MNRAEEDTSVFWETEVADETYVKRCHSCGRRVETPFLYRGYVFCSEKCRPSFIAKEKKDS